MWMVDLLIEKFSINQYRFVYGPPRGGSVLSAFISYKNPLIYLHDFDKAIPKKDIIIVDDICDTGKTLKPFIEKGYTTACLFYKPRSDVKPTFYIEETNEWIVFPYETWKEPINRKNDS